jgi:hypothetical protein
MHCGIGSCGVPRPSLAGYVRELAATGGAPTAGTGLMLTMLKGSNIFMEESNSSLGLFDEWKE